MDEEVVSVTNELVRKESIFLLRGWGSNEATIEPYLSATHLLLRIGTLDVTNRYPLEIRTTEREFHLPL